MGKRTIVGQYIENYNKILKLFLPEQDIYLYPGLEKHLIKKHKKCLVYIKDIPNIIKNPDYIGRHPDIPFSVEFVKKIDENILVAVKLDERYNYYYISNIYEISEGKIRNKLFSGRLQKYI